MFRKSGSDSQRLALIFFALFLLASLFPSLTLFSGQLIKQFETYSLAESISRVGWNPFATTIPCDGGIRWVLELPIYAVIGGFFVKNFQAWPSLWPLSVFGFFLFALHRFRKSLAPESRILPWVAVASAPVFLRFSTQFLADPFALALLILGASFYLEHRKRNAFLFFLIAVSVKPTVLPSVLFFRWAFTEEPIRKRVFKEGLVAFALLVPFVAWTLSVKELGIRSPLNEGGILAVGRDWSILLTQSFYSKFFVWTAFKGVGIPLAAAALYGAFRIQDVRIQRLALWSLGIFPYWFFVRRLNVIHDYYSLSFFFPIAVLGALSVAQMKRVSIFVYLFTIAQGVGLFLASGLSLPRDLQGEDRPIFCGKEFRSESLMGP